MVETPWLKETSSQYQVLNHVSSSNCHAVGTPLLSMAKISIVVQGENHMDKRLLLNPVPVQLLKDFVRVVAQKCFSILQTWVKLCVLPREGSSCQRDSSQKFASSFRVLPILPLIFFTMLREARKSNSLSSSP